MARNHDIARLVLAGLLIIPAFASIGCSKMFRVMIDGDERGGRVTVDSPEFRLDAAGGPGGGRISIDSPQFSFNGRARPMQSYPRRQPRRRLPLGPSAPGSSFDASGPSAPDDGSLPADYDSPLDYGTDYAPEVLASNKADGPSAPMSYGEDDKVRRRFVQQQKASADPSLRSKVDPLSLEEAANEVAMLEELNRIRQKNGLRSLQTDPKMDAVARRHSQEMDALNYFAHESPVEKNETLRKRLAGGGVQYTSASENLAKFPYKLGSNVVIAGTNERTAQDPIELAQDMMVGYMESPGHKAHILDPEMRYVGIGTVIGKHYARNTQNFRN